MKIAVYHSKEMLPYRGELIFSPPNEAGELGFKPPREDYHTYAFYSLKGSNKPRKSTA